MMFTVTNNVIVSGRIGRPSHKLVIPKILGCLENKPEVTEEMFKALSSKLYAILSWWSKHWLLLKTLVSVMEI